MGEVGDTKGAKLIDKFWGYHKKNVEATLTGQWGYYGSLGEVAASEFTSQQIAM